MKALFSAAIAALVLSACAGGSLNAQSGLGMGQSVAKMAIDSQCRTELNKRTEWRAVALAMTAEQQAEWENKICGCASEEAMQQVTVSEAAELLNPTTRNQAIADVTSRTVSACVKRLYTR